MPTRRFQPLKSKDSRADQAYSEISQVIDALAPLEQYPLRTEARINPAAGQFVRVAPRSTGMEVVLPSPSPANFGQTITLFAMSSLGTLRIRSTTGTVNGATAVTYGSGITALIVLTSDGESRWATSSALGSLPDISASRILGRAEGAGTGPVQQLTGAQVGAILDSVTFVWTGSHTFNGVFIVDSPNDATLRSAGGLWLSAVHAAVTTPSVTNGAIYANATVGIVLSVDPTTPVSTVSAGQLLLECTGDAWYSTTGGGLMLSTEAAHPTGVTNGFMDLRSLLSLRVFTAGVERLEIEADGAWQLAGDTGTTGEVLTTQGASAAPIWLIPPQILEIRYNQAADASISEAVPAGCTWFEVEGVGGGGGGGGADADDVKDASGGSGGGAGAWFRHRFTVTTGTITGAIGAAGTAGAATGGNGGVGGTTTVTYDGVSITGPGGNGGDGVTSAASPGANAQLWISQGSTGGAADTNATERAGGGDGDPGFGFSVSANPNSAVGGTGGASKFGGGGRGGRVIADGASSAGTAATAPGAGGGGGARTSTGAASTGALGGLGAPGAMKITFYSGTRPTEATIN
jgi:hypothetical protein